MRDDLVLKSTCCPGDMQCLHMHAVCYMHVDLTPFSCGLPGGKGPFDQGRSRVGTRTCCAALQKRSQGSTSNWQPLRQQATRCRWSCARSWRPSRSSHPQPSTSTTRVARACPQHVRSHAVRALVSTHVRATCNNALWSRRAHAQMRRHVADSGRCAMIHRLAARCVP